MAFSGIYKNRRVLVTGHTGFKGSWLCAWLLRLGAKVAGFSVDIPTDPSNFEILGLEKRIEDFRGDIRERKALRKVMDAFEPEIVFHLAAQAIVRRSYDYPTLTFETNVMGTMNVLECMRQQPSVVSGVIITTDKCYRNVEWLWGYRENDMLGGDDPYSASKACAELVSQSYSKSYFQDKGNPRIATTRAGNVIGGGDWAPDRIVADFIRAWAKKTACRIRNPQATRPWQHVLEPLSGYLWLGTRLWENDASIVGEAFNFGPSSKADHTVRELIDHILESWPGASWSEDPGKHKTLSESTLLKLCCDKALNLLGWHSILSFPEITLLTAEWYRTYYEKGKNPMYELTQLQIKEYMAMAREEGLLWARR
jgi:CDP-glucose 4,6-dehydratase